jgi:HK97 family phage major capsid protein/HK97 family phage prohead protease
MRQLPEVNRSFSVLEVKAVDEEQRIITGVATTPEPDRVGDIIEPMGVKYRNPLPLLWQHRSSEPVGKVTFDKPTKDGITFKAQLAKVTEPGKLKDRIDEAWQSIKLGLVRAVSIGFRAIEMSFLDDGGIRFLKSEVLELSLVTIPANQDATISSIKSIDDMQLAASGRHGRDAPFPPGVSGSPKPKAKEAITVKKTITEQIKQFIDTRDAKQAEMTALMEKAADESTTLDEAEKEKYDTLAREIKEIDEHVARLKAHEVTMKAQAVAVAGSDPQSAAASRAGVGHNSDAMGITRVQVLPTQLPKGTAFTRYVLAMVRAKGNRLEALDNARIWRDSSPEVEKALSIDVPSIMKAAIGAGTTLDSTWASPLVAYTIMASEFIELLRPATIIGRIAGLRRVPFNIQMPRTTTGSSVGWVGENAPKPVTAMAFDTVTLRWAKAAGIIVLTEELVRFSNPSAEAVVRNDLIEAMTQFLDRDFVDPAKAEVLNVSPASITNGVTPVTATGTTAAAFRADARTMFQGFLTANLGTSGGTWIMTESMALSLGMMVNALGQAVYPGVSASGGTLLGYPVVTSENLPGTGGSPADGSLIIFMKPSEIMLADDGQVVIDASREASVQMDSTPDSPPTASSNMVSLWQMNLTALRAERWINWKKRRSTAVAYIQNAKYAE